MGVNRAGLARRHQASRQALLEALLRLLDEGREQDISYRELAEAAGVSERTVFRYFDSRDALRAAMVPLIHARLEGVAPPDRAALIPDYVERLYQVCEANAGLVRSLLHTDLGRDLLRDERARRVAALRGLLAAVGAASARELDAAATTIRYLASGQAWAFYRFQVGLSLAAATFSARWAVSALLERVGVSCPGKGSRG